MKASRPAVVHVAPQFFGLTETFIYGFLTHLQRFRPVCISWGTSVINGDIFPFPSRDLYGFPRNWWGSWDRLLAVIRQRVEGRWQRLEPGRPPGVLAWATNIVRRRRPRLLHAHFGPTGWQALALRREFRLPLVTSFYGYDTARSVPSEGETWSSRRAELFSMGDLFLVEGPVMRRRLIDLGCPPSRVRIQRIGVNLMRLAFRRRGAESGRRVVLFAGRLCEKKGLRYALQAVASVSLRRKDFEFRIIGDGEDRETTDALVHQLGLREFVRCLGSLPYHEYLAELERADILVVPSVTAADGDNEGGAPTVVLEAQALGVPVLASNHADIPNVTRPGLSAVIVPERNSECLAKALWELLEHPDRWAAMGSEGRRFVSEFHDVDREVAHLEELYSEVCSDSVGSGMGACGTSHQGRLDLESIADRQS